MIDKELLTSWKGHRYAAVSRQWDVVDGIQFDLLAFAPGACERRPSRFLFFCPASPSSFSGALLALFRCELPRVSLATLLFVMPSFDLVCNINVNGAARR